MQVVREYGDTMDLDTLHMADETRHDTYDRQITDVDIPDAIAKTAEATAQQLELNKLAGEKEEEAKKNYNAAQWDAKTKEILSQPAMLALKKLEIEALWASKGVSPYGNNNVFGNMEIIKGIR